MKPRTYAQTLAAGAAVAVIVLAGVLISPRVLASEDGDEDRDPRIERGFQISPVPLNMNGKHRALVGIGSYIVNAQGDCNGCHTNPEFANGGDPYFGEPKHVNSAGFLGGGVDFGAFGPTSPDIVSRNLTPDKTGRPEGGRPFSEFLHIMRTGEDLDHLHPSCSATVTTNCLPPPFDGSRLQIMPWVTYQSMTDHDLRAIYEYLSAIPCVAGPPAPSPLHNDCD
jgi:hypothetical protein